MHCIARGQTGFDYRYWFDNDYSTVRQGHSETDKWQVDADMDGLSESLHSIHLQVIDSKGVESAPITRHFYRIIAPESATYRCWVDDDPTTMTTGKYTGAPVMVDISQISEGYHVMRVQIEDVTPSAVVSRPFVKIPQTEGVEYLKCLCVVDDVFYKEENVTSAGGIINWNFDVSSLQQGFHRMQVQVITPSGAATSTYNAFFLRTTTDTEMADMKCVYAIDGNEFNTEAGRMSNGAFHCDLDVAHLSDGLHRIAYMLTNGKGVETKVQTQFFVKTPLGGNGITQYQYWLNDNDDNKQTITLAERQDPFSLISLIPVESQPIRSSCFEFRIEEGAPMLYAKNNFHIRFYDVSGRFTDASKQYVDERVSEAITNIEPIFSDVTKHINSPEENTIKWFSMEAVRGDSLAIKSDNACTLQLFSPSGKEVYNVNGPNSIAFGGVHAEEDGTYYMAVHDVTARNTSIMNVDYKHIDKYAVLSYTPDSIGTMTGYIEVALNGNGYDKLQGAILCMNNNMIDADSIEIISKSRSILRFKLWGDEEHGEYNLKLRFQDNAEFDSIIVNNAITFVEEEMGEIKVDVISHRVVGYPYPVSIKVTNTGNVSMMYVPFKIACTFNLLSWEATASPGQSAWASMQPMNFSLAFDADYDPDKNEYYAPYNPYTLSYDLFGTGLPGMVVNMFIPILGPHETKEFIVGFIGSGHAKFNLYAWTGVPMNSNYDDTDEETNIYSIWKYVKEYQKWKAEHQEQSLAPLRRRAPLDHLNHLNNLFDVSDQINERASFAGRSAVAAGLGIGGYENGLRLQGIHAYTDNDYFAKDVLADYESDVRQNIPTPGQIAGILGMPDWLQALLGLQERQASCGNPMPQAHGIEIWAPGDPNDLIGYTSESGSKFMREEIGTIPYTIEFENDPEIANASAHTIIVTDTLDAELFDLSTFEPTSVKIGNVIMNLDGEKQFTRSMDLRPSIDVIAEVSLDYNEAKGIALWTITSLDPMSMEPTQDAMQGALPVNINGNGMGEVSFNIKLKQKLTHEQSVSNRAAIVFDKEAVIMTPTWTNTVDAVAPTSVITDVSMASASTAAITVSAIDELSKPWKYDVYQRLQDSEEWTRAAVNIPVDSVVIIPVGNSKTYEYFVLATDSAGNVEVKEPQCEFRFTTSMLKGDINSDGEVTAQDASLVQQLVAGKITLVDESIADVNNDGKVDAQDASLIQQYVAGKITW